MDEQHAIHLRQALDALKPEHREILVMKYVQEHEPSSGARTAESARTQRQELADPTVAELSVLPSPRLRFRPGASGRYHHPG